MMPETHAVACRAPWAIALFHPSVPNIIPVAHTKSSLFVNSLVYACRAVLRGVPITIVLLTSPIATHRGSILCVINHVLSVYVDQSSSSVRRSFVVSSVVVVSAGPVSLAVWGTRPHILGGPSGVGRSLCLSLPGKTPAIIPGLADATPVG